MCLINSVRCVVLALGCMVAASPAVGETFKIQIDTSTAEHKMGGGIGASWHAIRQPVPDALGGSAWGGNPPLDQEKTWQQIYAHANWLGLDWIRVEFCQRMYEPQRGEFDWDNEEMQSLYRILDWCEKNKVDVFLTQMWNQVEWNAYPTAKPLTEDSTLTELNLLTSAPYSVKEFATGLATFVEHLVRDKKYTCLRWLCIANEPGHNCCWWQGPDGSLSIKPGLVAARKALDERGIDLPLSGPDWVDIPDLVTLTPKGDWPMMRLDFDEYVGAYDVHCWMGLDAKNQKTAAEWAAYAHKQNKPFFFSEMGDFHFGFEGTSDGPRSYDTALSVAEIVVRGIGVGVDGFNRWSFLNRGDLDGKFQLVRTWNIEAKRFYADAAPEPVPYYAFAMLTRFLPKHSEALKCMVSTGQSVAVNEKLLAAAMKSPKGNLTVIVLNLDGQPADVQIELAGLTANVSLSLYQVTEERISQPDFKLAAQWTIACAPASPAFPLAVPPRSITTLSTYALQPSDPGIIAE